MAKYNNSEKVKSKKVILISLCLFILFLSLNQAAAEIELKTERVKIVGEESLSTLLQYQKDEDFRDQIITKEGPVCYLRQSLYIAPQSTFRLEGKDCQELRMYPETYIRVAGTAYFLDIKVTSVDPQTKRPILLNRQSYNTIRPYIYTDTTADYIHIEDSEFSYLGYYDESKTSWGVSFWHLKSGHVADSEFHHNYFGLYTWDSKDVTIENSKFHDNLEYGLDFHDYSDNFVIRDNSIYNNGNHGIIFSKFCDNNKIINNHVYDHTLNAFVKGEDRKYGLHGIMLHEESNNNLISGNTLENNDRAILIYRSHDNIIEENLILNDRRNGIYLDHSFNNIIRDNVSFNTGSFGLYSYYSQNNKYSGNYFDKGTYFKDEMGEQQVTFASDKKYVPEDIQSIKQELAFQENKIPEEQSKISSWMENVESSRKRIFQSLGSTETAENPISDFSAFKIYYIIGIGLLASLVFGTEFIYKRMKK